MTGLASLIALQNKAKAAPVAPPVTAPAGTQQPDTPATPTPESKPAGMKLNLLSAGKALTAKPDAAPKAPAIPASTPEPAPVASGLDSDTFTLQDLAGFDAGTVNETRNAPQTSEFLDEIEATAPERAIDSSLTAQQMAFIESLDSIYPVLHDPEMFAQSVRMIMMELQENKEYVKLVCDQDVHTMIRGMRNSMGLARIKKTEKSRKTGVAGKKAAQKKSGLSEDDMNLLDKLMGGDLDD